MTSVSRSSRRHESSTLLGQRKNLHRCTFFHLSSHRISVSIKFKPKIQSNLFYYRNTFLTHSYHPSNWLMKRRIKQVFIRSFKLSFTTIPRNFIDFLEPKHCNSFIVSHSNFIPIHISDSPPLVPSQLHYRTQMKAHSATLELRLISGLPLRSQLPTLARACVRFLASHLSFRVYLDWTLPAVSLPIQFTSVCEGVHALLAQMAIAFGPSEKIAFQNRTRQQTRLRSF